MVHMSKFLGRRSHCALVTEEERILSTRLRFKIDQETKYHIRQDLPATSSKKKYKEGGREGGRGGVLAHATMASGLFICLRSFDCIIICQLGTGCFAGGAVGLQIPSTALRRSLLIHLSVYWLLRVECF